MLFENNGRFKLLDIDSGSEFSVKRDCLRKPTEVITSLPVRCYLVKLMFLENVPTSIANNKALMALETCVTSAVEFIANYGENNSVDLLFVTKEKQSLCKKLLPMVFEPAAEIMLPKSNAILAENRELPLTPPHTPITRNPITITANENVVKLPVPKQSNNFTIDDLNVIPLKCGDRVALYVIDPTSILDANQHYITAADYNKEVLAKMEKYLQSVGEYCKSEKAPKGGYAPK